jgi:hypothetical protein
MCFLQILLLIIIINFEIHANFDELIR